VRTESYKRGFVSILLASAMLLSMVFIATPVLAPAIISHPGGTTVMVEQGKTFTLSHRLRWDETAAGYYTVTLYWTYGGDQSWNFTFVEASAYFVTGPYAGQSIEATVNIDDDGNMVSMTVGAYAGDPRDGEFNVDITFRASGTDGTPHRPGDHPISYSRIRCNEQTTVDLVPDNVTIRVLAWSQGVVVRGKATSYSVNREGVPPWKAYALGDNGPVVAAQRIGSGAVVAGGIANTCRGGPGVTRRWTPGEMDNFLHAAFQWMVPGATRVLWFGDNRVYWMNQYRGCRYLIDNLRALGYTVENTDNTVRVEITSSLLANYDILVLPPLQGGINYLGGDPATVSDAEVAAIVSFVQGGKGLLIMEGADYLGNNFYKVQNKILRGLGFAWGFQHDQVTDDTNNTGGINYQPVLDVLTDNPIGSAYQARTGKTTLNLYSGCFLVEWPTFAVDVSISPSESSAKYGENVTFNVTVRNTGTAWDNYAITVSSALGWTLNYTVPARVFLNPGENFSFVVEENIENDVYCTRDNLTVQAVGQESFWAPAYDNAVAKAHSLGKALLLRGVAVEIEPGHQEAELVIDPEWGDKRYDPLTFKVIVKNTGVLDDKYVLSVSDDKGWMLELMPIELYIEAGKSDIAVLSVTVPKDAVGCTTDTITIEAKGTMATGTDTDPENAVIENTCTVHVAEARGVRVDILPWEVQTGTPGSKLRWIVKVKNLGNVEDTYSLSVSQNVRDNERGYNAWSYTLEPSNLTLPGCNFGQAILEVTIPSDLKTCVWNDITVTATGTGVSDDATVQAHVLVPGPRVPQGWIKLTVEVEVIAIEVWPTSWNFGILDEAEIAQTASDYFTVRNVGNKDVDITIAGNDAKSEPGAPVATWTLDELGNIGLDRYVMWFGSPPTTLLDKTGNTLVSGLKPGEEYNFGLKIQAPSSITVPSRMWTVVTLTAVRA
jgi:hypothetical protein